MPIRDENVDWIQKRIFVPATAFTGMGKNGTSAAQSWGAGNDELVNVGSKGYSALPYGANTDTNYHFLMTPYDLDITKAIIWRVHWSNGTSGADAKWVLTYQVMNAPTNCDLVATGGTAVTPGSTNLGALPTTSGVATALDTVIPTATSAGANYWDISDWGIINKNTLTSKCYGLVLKLMIDTVNNTPSVLGLEMRYTPRRTVGLVRNRLGAKRLQEPLGTQWTMSKQEGL